MAAPSHLAENVFWVPREVRWEHLQANARQPEIGKLIDDAAATGRPFFSTATGSTAARARY